VLEVVESGRPSQPSHPSGAQRRENLVRGSGFDYQSLDLRISRTFPLTRGLTLEAILEGFMIF
jgi:hypothetical protein